MLYFGSQTDVGKFYENMDVKRSLQSYIVKS